MPHCRPMPTSRGSGMISASSRLMALFSTSPACVSALSAYPWQRADAPPLGGFDLLLQLMRLMHIKYPYRPHRPITAGCLPARRGQ